LRFTTFRRNFPTEKRPSGKGIIACPRTLRAHGQAEKKFFYFPSSPGRKFLKAFASVFFIGCRFLTQASREQILGCTAQWHKVVVRCCPWAAPGLRAAL
jgi:hypothetical protein